MPIRLFRSSVLLLVTIAVAACGGSQARAATQTPFSPMEVRAAFRSTGFQVLPDLNQALPKALLADYGFLASKTERVVYGDVFVWTSVERARQAASAALSGQTLCGCRPLRVRNVVLEVMDLSHVKPAPLPHYASDRRLLVAALQKLGRPVTP